MSFNVVTVNGVIQLDIPAFRDLFPQLTVEKYPDTVVTLYWNMATNYMTADQMPVMELDSQFLLINFMTAHLIAYQDMIIAGNAPAADGGMGFTGANIVTDASEDNVSVKTLPPPTQDDYFAWFMSTTVYGRQFYALLDVKSQVGILVGGGLGLTAVNGYRTNW